jgi:hypothetical protein
MGACLVLWAEIGGGHFTESFARLLNGIFILIVWPLFVNTSERTGKLDNSGSHPGRLHDLPATVTLFVPLEIVKTRRVTKPAVIAILDRFASTPSWTGRTIGLLCGGAVAVLKVQGQ